ncbi:MAG TPA: hypothetical protein VJM34_01040 [Novosphingobium sp.]|nr:hypothetical protein [Novosphingobium sp.]
MGHVSSTFGLIAIVLASLGPTGADARARVPSDGPAEVRMTVDGQVLFAPNGMALYFAGKDGRSTCTNEVERRWNEDQVTDLGDRPITGSAYLKSCATYYPPYLAGVDDQPVGDFTLVDRPEGRQWAWKGRPLHFSTKDEKPGERNGTFRRLLRGFRTDIVDLAVVPPPYPLGMKVLLREEGAVLATSNSAPLYTTTGDEPSTALFQPILAPAMASPSGDWSIVEGARGLRQYAFRKMPLYEASSALTEAEVRRMDGWKSVVVHPTEGRPSQIGEQKSLDGDVYSTTDGRSLYVYSCATRAPSRGPYATICDNPGDPAGFWTLLCGVAEECARRWKPYLATEGSKSLGDWSVVEVAYPMFSDPQGVLAPPGSPRVKAWAYRGAPLYTYYQDKEPGDIWGSGTRSRAPTGGAFNALHLPGRGR